jgi:hypothetical protein
MSRDAAQLRSLLRGVAAIVVLRLGEIVVVGMGAQPVPWWLDCIVAVVVGFGIGMGDARRSDQENGEGG